MGKSLDLTKVSRVDELTIRKVQLEQMLIQAKENLKNRVHLMLSKSFDEQVEEKTAGLVVFLERWIKDIDEEIESL